MHAGGEQFDINTLSAAPEKLEAGSYLLSLPHPLRNTHMEDTVRHKEHGLRIAGYILCISGGGDDAAAGVRDGLDLLNARIPDLHRRLQRHLERVLETHLAVEGHRE